MTSDRKTPAGSSSQALQTLLADGYAGLGLVLSQPQQQQLLDYLALLAKWNGVYNLTAIRDPRQMAIQHVLDSLAIVAPLAALHPGSVLDVGSGGGLPGVVLAIVRPDWQVTVNDIVHKKTAFLTQAKGELGLGNLNVVTGRVELLEAGRDVPDRFDAVVSRAFAELSEFVGLARHLVAPGGVMWAMKGVLPEAEIVALPDDVRAGQPIRLTVPFLSAERHLIKIDVNSRQT